MKGIRAYFSLDPTPAKKGMKEAAGAVRKGTKQINSDLKSIKRYVTMAFSGWQLKQLGQDFISTAMDMDAMRRSMGAAVGGMEKGRREINNLRAESLKLGLSFKDQAKDYTILSAAARGTALEGEGIRKVWRSLQSAAVSLQMTTAQTTGTIYAFRDMLSKGTVQSEELKRQLGNRLPGAFRLAAEAMGITTKALADQMKQGKIMADDFLPALAKRLDEVYGESAINASKSMRSELNKMKSAWVDFQDTFMTESGAADAVSELLRETTKLVSTLIYNMDRVVAASRIFWDVASAGYRNLKHNVKLAHDIIFDFDNFMKKSISEIDFAAIFDPSGMMTGPQKVFDYLLNNFQGLRDSWIKTKSVISAGLIHIGTFFNHFTNIVIAGTDMVLGKLIPGWDKWANGLKIILTEVRLEYYEFTKSVDVLWDAFVKKFGKFIPDFMLDKAKKDNEAYIESRKITVVTLKKELKELKEIRAQGVAVLTIGEKYEALIIKQQEETEKMNQKLKENKKTEADALALSKKQTEEMIKIRDLAAATKMEMPEDELILTLSKDKFEEFLKSVKMVSDQMAAIFKVGIDAMAASLSNFVMTGKMEWKELQDAVISAMVNIVIKEQILKRMSAGMTLLTQAAGAAIGNMFGPIPTGRTNNIAPAATATPSGIAYPHANGGMITEPVIGVGLRSGKTHSFAENEDELVLNQKQMKAMGKGGTAVSVTPIINITTPPGTTSQTQKSSDGLNMDVLITAIENQLSTNIMRGSGLSDTLAARYGLNRGAGANR